MASTSLRYERTFAERRSDHGRKISTTKGPSASPPEHPCIGWPLNSDTDLKNWPSAPERAVLHFAPLVARNMATLLTANLHPMGGLEIWSGTYILTSLSTRIPILTDKDGCPLDTQQLPQPMFPLVKVGPLVVKRLPQLSPIIGPSLRRPPFSFLMKEN